MGKIKRQLLPSLENRKAQYAAVLNCAKDLYHAHQHEGLGFMRKRAKETFPEISDLPDSKIPPLRQYATISKLVLAKRWGVTVSTVKTRLKR